MSDIQDMFDAEDAAGMARKEKAIRELAEKIFIATSTVPGNFANPDSIGYCFNAAKSFIEHKVKS